MKRHFIALAVAFCIIGSSHYPAQAIPTVIDFESLVDSEAVTTQFAGLTFTNTTALTAGIGLNETEFPPASGVNVVFDDGGSIIIDFSPLTLDVSGFFTYSSRLTMTAFDLLLTPVDEETSLFTENFMSSGNPPNEFLVVSFAGGIARVIIEGDPAGSSFVLDDLTFNPIPEPATLLLFATGLAGIVGWRTINRRTSSS